MQKLFVSMVYFYFTGGGFTRREHQMSGSSTMSNMSVQSDSRLMNRRVRKPGIMGQRQGPSVGRLMNSRRSSVEQKPQSVVPEDNSQQHQEHSSSVTGIYKRINSYECLKDITKDKDEPFGSLTVRTEPCIANGDSSSKIGLENKAVMESDNNLSDKNVDDCKINGIDEQEDSSNSTKGNTAGRQVSSSCRSLTPIPAINSSPKQSKSEVIFNSGNDSLSPTSRQMLGLPSTTSPVLAAENISSNHSVNQVVGFTGKKLSIHSPSSLLKRPVYSSPDMRRTPTEEQHRYSRNNHMEPTGRLSSTSLFRANLQRGREKREVHNRLPGQNPGRNGAPLLSHIAKKQIGQFYLVFPFNEITQAQGRDKLDAKLVIKEIQKQQKMAENGHKSSDSDTSKHWGLRIWAPLRSVDTE